MESKMIKVKVRIKDIDLQQSTNFCCYLKKSRSYLVVDSFNRLHKKGFTDLLVKQVKNLDLYLKCNYSFSTICLPFGVYIAMKKACRKYGFSLNKLINFCLMYIMRLVRISKKVRDSLLVKHEKYDSVVKERYSVYMLMYGYQKRLKKY